MDAEADVAYLERDQSECRNSAEQKPADARRDQEQPGEAEGEPAIKCNEAIVVNQQLDALQPRRRATSATNSTQALPS
jgi:hypothetical protein